MNLEWLKFWKKGPKPVEALDTWWISLEAAERALSLRGEEIEQQVRETESPALRAKLIARGDEVRSLVSWLRTNSEK